MAWISNPPAGDELPAGARSATATGAAQRFSQTRTAAVVPGRQRRWPPPRGPPGRAGPRTRPRTRRSRRCRRSARRARALSIEPSSTLRMNAMSRMRMIPRSTRSMISGATSPVGCRPAIRGRCSRSGPSLPALVASRVPPFARAPNSRAAAGADASPDPDEVVVTPGGGGVHTPGARQRAPLPARAPREDAATHDGGPPPRAGARPLHRSHPATGWAGRRTSFTARRGAGRSRRDAAGRPRRPRRVRQDDGCCASGPPRIRGRSPG